MFNSRLALLLISALVLAGICVSPAAAAVVTDFSLTFETSPSNIVGHGTLGITDFIPGSSYGSGDPHVTEFDATINGSSFNFLPGFSALVFNGGTLTAVTAGAGANPSATLFTISGLEFSYFLNGLQPVSLSGTLVVQAVPEPSTWAMMILGFFGVGFMAYRRKQSVSALRVA